MAPTPVGWRHARIHAWVRDAPDATWDAQVEYLGAGRYPHLAVIPGQRVVPAHACLEQCVVWRSRWYPLDG